MSNSLIQAGTAQSANNGGFITMNLPAALRENDLVIVWGGHSNRAGSIPGPVTAGYTSLVTQTAASPFFNASYKRMGTLADTTVNCRSTGNASDATAYGYFCLRGAIQTGSPIDVAVVTAGPTTSTNPDPGSIVTTTHGAWILALASSAVNDAAITVISGYENLTNASGNDNGEDYSTAGCTLVKSTAGGENPAAYGSWASGAWYAVTIAIKPEPLKVLSAVGVG